MKKKKKTSGDIRDSVNGGEANVCQICLGNRPDKLEVTELQGKLYKYYVKLHQIFSRE